MLPHAPDTLILMALTIPLVGALLIPLFHDRPNAREAVTLITAGALALTTWSLLPHVLAGARPEALDIAVVPGLRLAFQVEPLGMLFALVASTLWIVNSVYSIGYMRGNDEPRQTSFYICFAVALWATMGIAFAKNLFTLFVFYEILTLSTYPLVAHKANADAIRGGSIYLLILIGTSMVLLLPAIAWTWVLAGTLDFTPGGILAGKAAPAMLAALLGAVCVRHRQGGADAVPLLASRRDGRADAGERAPARRRRRQGRRVHGPQGRRLHLRDRDAEHHRRQQWLVYAACFTLLVASIIALSRGNLKARLAYSTVSQLAYIVLGAALATSSSVIGAGMHIAMHAAGKITLFFCAGAIYVAAHKTEISQLDGIGRKMPITMAAFMIGSLSIIGLPPFGGTWSKWYLAVGSLEAGYQFVVAVLMISSLLNVAYLMPIVARAFFKAAEGTDGTAKVGIEEAPLPCVLALAFTALLCLILFIFPDRIESLLRALVAVG